MRKEVTTASFIGLIILTFIVNFDLFFNSMAGFFLIGVIPGTQITMPSLVIFTVAIVALSAMVVKLLNKYIPKHINVKIKTLGGRFIQIKV